MHQPPWLPRMPCPISACLRGKEPPSEVPSSALIIPVETYPLSNSSSQKEGGINSPPAAIWHPHCLLHLEQMPVLVWTLGHLTVPRGKRLFDPLPITRFVFILYTYKPPS